MIFRRKGKKSISKKFFKNKIGKRVLTALAVVTVFCTTYMLILPALTLETTHIFDDVIVSAPTESGAVVEISGDLPNGAEVSLEPVAVSDEKLPAYLGEEKAAAVTKAVAYDISVSDGQKEWQPESAVSVALTDCGLVPLPGEGVGILHLSDGNEQVEEIDGTINGEGDLSFEAEGFSVYIIYTFTVDFEYEGTVFHMDGLDSISFDELFARLGIEREATEIESASFSDETLVKTEQGENGELRLVSLKPFDTTEELFITFTDGTELSVPVTDAQPNGTIAATWATNSGSGFTVSGNNVLADPAQNAPTALRTRIDLFQNAATYEPGEVEIRMPYHVVEGRDGEWADTFSIAIPQAPEVNPDVPFSYTVDEDNNEVIITNNVRITTQLVANYFFSYTFIPSEIEDGTTGSMDVSYRLKSNGEWSDPMTKTLTYEINTEVDPLRVLKAQKFQYETWDPKWGTAPADAADSVFIVWRVFVAYNEQGGTQPSRVYLSETPGDGGEIVAWFEESKSATAGSTISDTDFINNYNSSNVQRGTSADDLAAFTLDCENDVLLSGTGLTIDAFLFDIVTAYPKSMKNGGTFTNSVVVHQTPLDEIDPEIPYTASANYRWTNNTFSYQTGNTLYKYGNSSNATGKKAYQTERPNQSSYNHSGLMDTGAITMLENNIPVTFSYKVSASADQYGVKYENYHVVYEGGSPVLLDWQLEAIDDQMYLEGELLEPGDYEITEMKLSGNYEAWEYADGQYRIVGHGGDNDHVIPNMAVYYKTGLNGDWNLLPTSRPFFNSMKPGTFPDGTYQVKIVYGGNDLSKSLDFTCYIRLNPTDHVKSLIRNKDKAYFTNIAAMRIIDSNGNYILQKDESTISGDLKNKIIAHDQNGDYGLDSGKVMYHKQQTDELDTVYFLGNLSKSTSYTDPVNDAANSRVVLHYTVAPQSNQLGFSMCIPAEQAVQFYRNNAAMQEYVEDFMAQADMGINLSDFTYYDLLPAGMNVDRSTIKVSTQKDPTNLIDDLEIVDNWRNSGRTMIIAHVDASSALQGVVSGVYVSGAVGRDPRLTISAPIRLTFTAYYSWESIVDHGSKLHNVAALIDNSDPTIDFSAGFPDDTSGVASSMMNPEEKAAMDDLREGNDTNRNTLYAHVTTNIIVETAAVAGFHKRVKSADDDFYTEETSSEAEGAYSYSLRFATTENQNAKNVVLFDVLEKAYGTNAHWQGTFAGIDVSQMTAKGINPKIYYSTKTDIDPQNNSLHANLNNTTYWNTTRPANASSITAIAIDASKKTNNTDYVLPEKSSLVAIVEMTAPENVDDYLDPAVYAWNQSLIRLQQSSDNGQSWSSAKINSSNTAKVSLRKKVDFDILKVPVGGDTPIPGVSFELKDDTTGVVLKSGKTDDEGKMHFEGLPTGNTYTLTETATVEGFVLSGPWTVTVSAGGVVTVSDSSYDDGEECWLIENEADKVCFDPIKTDESGEPLGGAVFDLYGADADGEMLSEPMEGFTNLNSDKDGFVFRNTEEFALGTYYLVEKEAPGGYHMLSAPVKITVSLTGVTASVNGEPLVVNEDMGSYSIAIPNYPGDYEMPGTGGIGTTFCYILGVMLLCGTCALYLTGKRARRVK